MRIKTLVAAATAGPSGGLRRRGDAEPKALRTLAGPRRGLRGVVGPDTGSSRALPPGSAGGLGSSMERSRCSREMRGYKPARALHGDFSLFFFNFLKF